MLNTCKSTFVHASEIAIFEHRRSDWHLFHSYGLFSCFPHSLHWTPSKVNRMIWVIACAWSRKIKIQAKWNQTVMGKGPGQNAPSLKRNRQKVTWRLISSAAWNDWMQLPAFGWIWENWEEQHFNKKIFLHTIQRAVTSLDKASLLKLNKTKLPPQTENY